MLEMLREGIHNILGQIIDEWWDFDFSNMPQKEFEAEIYEYFKPQVEDGDYNCLCDGGWLIRNAIFDLARFYHINRDEDPRWSGLLI